MKRSLKITTPPAAELARARDEILEKLSSFDPARHKVRIVSPSDAEQQRREAIVDDITERLRAHKRPGQSEVTVHNQVVLACATVETAKLSTKPAVVDEITNELVDAARKLLRVLGNPDLPPIYVFSVFGYVPNWNQFIEHLERLAGDHVQQAATKH